MEKRRVAVPTLEEGGLDSKRSGHFGHCDVFTLVDVEGGEIKEVSTVPNPSHVQGGCMVPVNLLAEHKVDAIIVGGIGMRPLMGFRQAGIEVFHDDTRQEVRSAVEAFAMGELPRISDSQVCGGGGQGNRP